MTPVEKFQKTTNFDLQPFFELYVDFSNIHFSRISNYYTGRSARPNDSFDILNQLVDYKIAILNILMSYKHQLTNMIMWELVEDIDDIFTRIQTAQNAPKWLRVSSTKASFIQSPEIEYITSQNETLEDVSILRLGDDQGENNWKDIALRNQLVEEGYTPQGGALLSVNLRGVISQFTILSVVDTIIGKSVYGVDLKAKLEYIDDDLVVLSNDQTIIQSVLILSQMRKGDAPEFRDIGLQQAVAVGSTRGAIQFPAIFRQLADTFSTDDSLKDFRLIDLRFDKDGLRLDFEINTRLDEVLNQTLTI